MSDVMEVDIPCAAAVFVPPCTACPFTFLVTGVGLVMAEGAEVCWSTILLALFDSTVKVNCVFVLAGPPEVLLPPADCNKDPFSCPFCGVKGPCSAALLMA